MTSATNVVEVLMSLVEIESVNPDLGGSGEGAIIEFLQQLLVDTGLEVAVHPVANGLSNVVARLPGTPDAGTLLLEAHVDTVALPDVGLSARREATRVSGRGACDAKASCAAMVSAIASLAVSGGEHATVLFAGVVDEEVSQSGSLALVNQLPLVDAAVVGEPTELLPVREHSGLARLWIATHGVSAHTSRPQLGQNAIAVMANVILALGAEFDVQPPDSVGSAEETLPFTSTIIQGGKAPNMVPDRCELLVDRRILPTETVRDVLALLDRTLGELRDRGLDVSRFDPVTTMEPFAVPRDHPFVAIAEHASAEVLGHSVVAGRASFGSDAANLWGSGGIPTVVLGPGSIDQAHSDDEWVDLDQVMLAPLLYERIARDLGRGLQV